jgi:hypothetical protein
MGSIVQWRFTEGGRSSRIRTPAVYFEAGFANGLSREVIWCCKDSETAELHFDTRHLNHIVWHDAEDLKQRLADRIRATII